MSALSWVYDKIYVGPVAGGIEHLVIELLPRIRRYEGLKRWFFIRYVDDGGPHLRLRMMAAESPENLRVQTDQMIAQALDELAGVPPSFYQPTILLELHSGRVDPGVIRSVSSVYVPEVEKFGDHGIDIAEQLFEHSSELAIDVLRDERAELYSRKTLVPCFMQCVVDAFAPASGRQFWHDYTTYWLKMCRAPSVEWRPRFVAKAGELRAQGVPVVAPDSALPERAVSAMARWRQHLAAAATAYRVTRDDPPVSPVSLAFHFTHLMNNRLGIVPLEEAYYSALIYEGASLSKR